MPNGKKRLSIASVAAVSLAASGFVAAPATAQTSPTFNDDYYYCDDITQGGGYFLYPTCCRYDAEWGRWSRSYVWGEDICPPPYGYSNEPNERPAQEPADQQGA